MQAALRNPDGFTRGRIAAQGKWEGWREGGDIAFDRVGQTLAWSFVIPAKRFVCGRPMRAKASQQC